MGNSLTNVTVATVGSTVDFGGIVTPSMTVSASSTPTAFTARLEGSVDGTTWFTLASTSWFPPSDVNTPTPSVTVTCRPGSPGARFARANLTWLTQPSPVNAGSPAVVVSVSAQVNAS